MYLRAVLLLFFALAPSAGAGATVWRTVPEQSEISFEATQMGGKFTGRFSEFQADIRFDPSNLADASATVLVAIASVDTRNEDRDAQIVGPDWFDSAAFPQARFQTTAFRRDGERYVATARLTLRDVTRTVELPFTLELEDGNAAMTGELVVSRTEFGIGRGQWTDTAVVGDAVTIRIRLRASAD